MRFEYYMPTKIIFGSGVLSSLAEQYLPGKKALIVITNGKSMRNLGYLDRVISYLKTQNVEACVFDKCLPIPIAP